MFKTNIIKVKSDFLCLLLYIFLKFPTVFSFNHHTARCHATRTLIGFPYNLETILLFFPRISCQKN